MIYLFAYLILGVFALVGMLVDSHLRSSRTSSNLSNISKIVRRAYQPWQEAILERLIVPLIAGVVIIFAWPIVIAFAIYFYRRRKEEEAMATSFEPDHFTVKPSDLIERLIIEKVESSEIVYDPLLAVPPLPFGHLNHAWLDFKRQIQSEDEIWSFEASWGNYSSPMAVRSGYAALRHGAVVAIFIAKTSKCQDPAG